MMTYRDLRDFLDGYTTIAGEIQGDPASLAAEAAIAGLVCRDEEYMRQQGAYELELMGQKA